MKKISHGGVVQSVDENGVKVRIVQSSACASCKVASHCSAAESKEKVVEVRCANAMGKYKAGDIVTLSMSGQNGRDAVMLGFICPFLVIVAVLAIALYLTRNEGWAALMAVGALGPYYLLLWLLKDKISRKFAFYLED